MHETPWSLWQQQLDVNLKTAVLSCAAAVPHLLARGGGAIVNVGTRTATQPAAHLAAYAASKRAVLQLTEALAAELRDGNVTANAILPSVIDTAANRRGNPERRLQPLGEARGARARDPVPGRPRRAGHQRRRRARLRPRLIRATPRARA